MSIPFVAEKFGKATRSHTSETGTIWNIRNLLVTAVLLLSLFGLLMSGYVLLDARLERNNAAEAAYASETADRLLVSAGNWARERGAINLALNAAQPASSDQVSTISNFRKLADQSFEQALGRLTSSNFANKDKLFAAARQAVDRLAAVRQSADVEITKPMNARDAAVVSKWAPTITALIVASQDLRVAAAMEDDNAQTRLSSLQNFKHFIWVMSEYLGRERAAVAGIVAAGRPISAQELNTLGIFRGRVDAAWDYAQAYASKRSASPAITKAADRLRENLFGRFEETRRLIYTAGSSGGSYPVTGAEWFSQSTATIDELIALGEVASREASQLVEIIQHDTLRTLLLNATLMALSVLLACATLWIVLGRVVGSLRQVTAAMTTLAAGELDVEIPCCARRDEMGSMARALMVFKDGMRDAERLRAESREAEQRAALQRKADMNRLADDFEGAVGEIIETVSSASTELEASARTLTTTAARSQELATAVAAASEEASSNVASVASASEEMSSSVNEISRQVQQSAMIAGEAVKQARKTNDSVGELSKAGARIGAVVELINTIAEQTNLLALNATIEAARAGEAGRGFAVVAAEVKALAEQTAKATGEISQQIDSIQGATQDSVAAIKDIGDTIDRMSEIASTIAAAMEEQGMATQEISRNVQQAAQGTQQVSSNITDVQRGASETGSASSQVHSAAQSLSRDSNRLKMEVGKFLGSVRVA